MLRRPQECNRDTIQIFEMMSERNETPWVVYRLSDLQHNNGICNCDRFISDGVKKYQSRQNHSMPSEWKNQKRVSDGNVWSKENFEHIVKKNKHFVVTLKSNTGFGMYRWTSGCNLRKTVESRRVSQIIKIECRAWNLACTNRNYPK